MNGPRQSSSLDSAERIALVERDLLALVGRRRTPRFWADVDVRRLLIAEYGVSSRADVRAMIASRFGAARAPSASGVTRFWQSLDQFWKKAR